MAEWMPLEELERLLARVDVLEPLPPSELRELAAGSSLERLRARETLLVGPREHTGRVILLLEGRARVYEPGPRGRRLTVSVAEAGTVVGAAGLAPRPRGLQVEAAMPSFFCLVARGTFEEMVRRNPEVGLRLLRVLGERIVVLEARLAYKSIRARLAAAILRLVEGEGVVTPEGPAITTPYTHQQLASMIGAKREATTRAMGRLRDEGIVDVRARRIHVVDPAALRRASEEG